MSRVKPSALIAASALLLTACNDGLTYSDRIDNQRYLDCLSQHGDYEQYDTGSGTHWKCTLPPAGVPK